MECRLLLGAGEGPGGARAPLLPEREAQLLRRPQPLGLSGRNVAQGASSSSAHSRLRRKKQSSHATFFVIALPAAMPVALPSVARSRRESTGLPCREQGGGGARLRKCGGFRPKSPRSHRETSMPEAHAAGEGSETHSRHRIPSARMRILVTGVSGFAGAALVPRLREDGHELRGFARDPSRVRVDLPVVTGDAVTGEGLDEALDGIDVAYFLIHSMERGDDAFAAREAASAHRFVEAAAASRTAPGRVSRWDRARRPRALAAPVEPPRRRGGAARRPPRGGRAARVDRRRRDVAVVPLPRAPRGAHPRHPAAGLARASHPADRPARRRRAARGRRRRPSTRRAACRSTSPDPTS